MNEIKVSDIVLKVLNRLEERGHEAYIVGGCVRDSLLGLKPFDWDVTTSANIYEIDEIFDNLKIISEEYHVGKIVFPDEKIHVDIASFRKEDGYYSNGKPRKIEVGCTVLVDSKRRDFTINAMAYNPKRPLFDIYSGRQDLKKRLIRTIGVADIRFIEDPSRMIRGIRFASKLNFTIVEETLESIKRNSSEISRAGKAIIQSELEKILLGDRVGNALKLLLETKLLASIIPLADRCEFSKDEIKLINKFCTKIDNLKKNRLRIWTLFLQCFDKKRSLIFLEKSAFSNSEKELLLQGIMQIDDFTTIYNSMDVKKFIMHYGIERFVFLHNVDKAAKYIWPRLLEKNTIIKRNKSIKKIIDNNEPVFISDLAINGDDLVQLGISRGRAIGVVLERLTLIVHKKPDMNSRCALLKIARQLMKKLK